MLLTHFLPFPWPINYNRASRCNKSFTHSLLIWLKIEDLFPFPWNYGVCIFTSYKPQITQVNEEPALESSLDLMLMQHIRDVDATSSWWRPRTSRGARMSWSWSPASLVLSHLCEFSHPDNFVISRSCF
jgi:hypothetical protein